MTVLTVPDFAYHQRVDIPDLKAKTIVNNVELEVTPKPLVADNFMYDFRYNHDLPTIGKFGVVEIPANCDAREEAKMLMSRLSEVMGNGDAQGFTDTFLDCGKSPLLRP